MQSLNKGNQGITNNPQFCPPNFSPYILTDNEFKTTKSIYYVL